MNHFHKFIAACLITLVISLPTPAGEMNMPVIPPPPPPVITVVGPDGDTGTAGVNPTTELLIIVLETLLPIF